MVCSAEGCKEKSYARNLYKRHLNQLYQYGKVLKRTKFDPNEIRIENGIGIIVLRNQKGSEVGQAIIDVQDIERVKIHKWYLNNSGYAITRISRKEQLLLHRLIMDPSKSMAVDHINGNPLDNRRCNLRLCTYEQNMYNKKIRYDNSSGYTGIDFDKRRGKWRARINANKEQIHLGYFDTFEQAFQIRIAAEIKYFGDYRRYKNV